jgi:hypothetical protein
LKFSHFYPLRLELQAGFTGRIGQSLYATVVCKTCAIECNLLDTGRLLSDALADDLGRGGIATLAGATERLAHMASAVEALASTLVPSPEITLA